MHFLTPMLRQPSATFRLLNATRSIAVAQLVEGAFDSRARRRGLLGRRDLPADVALVIAPSSAIHTFSMAFPIDAVFVNRGGKVLKVVTALKRRRIAARPGAFAVVEFCGHHPGVARCEPGDVLTLECVTGARQEGVQ